MSQPDAIAAHGRRRRGAARARSTSWSTMPASSTSRRSRVPAGEVGRDPRDQPVRRLPRHAARCSPGMKARGWGRIVNVASAHGLVASPFKSAYVAAKHGLVGLTKVTALEGAEHGITCNAICPGYVWTPLVEKQIDDQAQGARHRRASRSSATCCSKNQPTKRFATVEEIGALDRCSCARDARRLDHRHGAAGRRRLDRALNALTQETHAMDTPIARAARADTCRRSAAPSRPARPTSRRSTSPCRAAARTAPSPGACSTACSRTSGIAFEGISATSAGAMNAAVLAYGLAEGGREGARKALAGFWRRISHAAAYRPAAALAARPADCTTTRSTTRRPS